jgi:hypothetical protein
MNWHGFMFRLWILGAVEWTAYSLWNFVEGCDYAPDGWMPCTGAAFDLSDWLWLIAQIAGPPLVVLTLGFICIWVLRGFEGPTNSN